MIQPAKDGPNRALDSLSHQGVARAFKHTRQSFSPLGLAGFCGDEILAQFDPDMKETAPFTVVRNRVVGFIVDGVRLVIADDEIGVFSQRTE